MGTPDGSWMTMRTPCASRPTTLQEVRILVLVAQKPEPMTEPNRSATATIAGADAAKAVTVQSGVQGRGGQAGAHGARWGVPLQQPAMVRAECVTRAC